MKANLKTAQFIALTEMFAGGILSSVHLPEYERDKRTQEDQKAFIRKAEEKRSKKAMKRLMQRKVK